MNWRVPSLGGGETVKSATCSNTGIRLWSKINGQSFFVKSTLFVKLISDDDNICQDDFPSALHISWSVRTSEVTKRWRTCNHIQL